MLELFRHRNVYELYNLAQHKYVFAEMFKKHNAGIVNAMALNKSNAMSERLNEKIQEIKFSAKGYRTFENFRVAILFYHGKLYLYLKKKSRTT